MILKKLLVGPLGVNCYILGDEKTREAIVIDPGGNAHAILASIQKHQLKVNAIVNTHAHFDHVGALHALRAETGAPFILHEDEVAMLRGAQSSAAMYGLSIPPQAAPDRTVRDGDRIECGDIALTVLHTPGHTPGGICLLQAKNVFVGDTLFQGGIGRTDFPGGDYMTLMTSIRDKLLPLPDDTIVYPGHGAQTTIGEEKLLNMFLRPLITGQWMV
jgi:glyoxylase-like metal-dependent hydrolase (beta-lactamase superfamily II)